jgi:hypothetical protein
MAEIEVTKTPLAGLNELPWNNGSTANVNYAEQIGGGFTRNLPSMFIWLLPAKAGSPTNLLSQASPFSH